MLDVDLDYKTVIAVAVVGAVAVWTVKQSAVKAIEFAQDTVLPAVNPVSQDNIFNRGFNAVYSALTGSEDSLGEDVADGVEHVSSFFDWLKGSEADPIAAQVVGG